VAEQQSEWPTARWSGHPPANDRRGRADASDGHLLDAIFPKNIQSDNIVLTPTGLHVLGVAKPDLGSVT
jgi:hypothetical protein